MLKNIGIAALLIGITLVVLYIIGLLFGLWLHTTICIWYDHGVAAMTWWLIGSALSAALLVVLLW